MRQATTTILLMLTVPNTFRGCSPAEIRRKLQGQEEGILTMVSEQISTQIDKPIEPEALRGVARLIEVERG